MKAFIDNLKTRWVEIKEEEGSIYLFQYDENNICISDSWHLSVKEAKDQATYEFGLKENDWIE